MRCMRGMNADIEEVRMRRTNAVRDWYGVGFKQMRKEQVKIGLLEVSLGQLAPYAKP